MALRATNTFPEALSKLNQELSAMMALPDADLEWLAQMQAQIVAKMREPIDNMQASGATAVPGAPPGAAPGGPPPGGPAGGPPVPPGAMPPGGPAAPAVPGIRQEAPMPNPDELRRLLAAGSGG